MKKNKQNYAFDQESLDYLFEEEDRQIARLSSPLVNAGVTSHDGDHSEN
jgi:hypothetical protein